MSERVAQELDHAGLLRPFLARRFRTRYDAVRPGSARRAELLGKLCHLYAEVLDWRYAREAVGADVTVKARRPEGLGALGRGEGVACFAVALVERL